MCLSFYYNSVLNVFGKRLHKNNNLKMIPLNSNGQYNTITI